MRSRTSSSVLLALVLVSGTVACRKFVTNPSYRRPAITSIVVSPTVLGPGDSTTITVHATDPNGDALVYDWDAYNGLLIQGALPGFPFLYNTFSNSRVFYRSSTLPNTIDTAFVFCSVRDRRGGGVGRMVQVLYQP